MKIDHVNIVVSDMETSVAFYTRLGLAKSLDTHIGGEWIARLTGVEQPGLRARVVFMEPPAGHTRLELIQYLVPQGREAAGNSLPYTIGVRHFALVVDNILKTYHELLEVSVRFFSEPQEVSGNPEVAARIGRKKLVYCLDPDGVIVELAEYS